MGIFLTQCRLIVAGMAYEDRFTSPTIAKTAKRSRRGDQSLELEIQLLYLQMHAMFERIPLRVLTLDSIFLHQMLRGIIKFSKKSTHKHNSILYSKDQLGPKLCKNLLKHAIWDVNIR